MTEVVITLAPSADPVHTRKKLTDAGLRNLQLLQGLGIILGEIDPGKRHQLASVEGVEAIEDNVTIQLPPPDAPIQ